MRIAREGLPTIGAVLFMAAGGWLISPPVSLGLLPFLALVIWFFRDPDREAPSDPSLWISPADGRVVEVEPYDHPDWGKGVRIGVFMSPMNVHVNRAPTPGRVERIDYLPGKRLVAFAPKASELNERLVLHLRTERGTARIVQIAGLLAGRIVCRARRGDDLSRGQRYGMIKLGSKVDCWLPSGVCPLVAVGDRVQAGRTPIGSPAGNE
jgi:phosphatidylserine decarboxylase